MRNESCALRTGQNSVGIALIMTHSRAELAVSETPLWFCVSTQPKHEHVAAAGLRRQLKVACFSPRLRYRKMTRRGAMWFVEAMFPGYLFAQFVYPLQHRQVQHSSGVRGIVHFGDYVATLDTGTVEALQQKAGEEEILTIDPEIQVGQSVRIAEGPFQGLEALVTHLLPAKERIRVLLEFLGRSLETEVPMPKVLPLVSPRA
jgi:transcriptional antiterminator RfaH